MAVLIVDVENSVTKREDGELDNKPYRSTNFLVSVGYQFVGEEEGHYDFYKHDDLAEPAPVSRLQAALDRATLVVGHNLRHDLSWLYECGFAYEGKVYDTMIGEYVMLRGQKGELSLAALAQQHGLPLKKSELIEGHWKSGVGFEAMPMELVEEYGRADVTTTLSLYQNQQHRLRQAANIGLTPVLDLMNDMLLTLIRMERNGIKIDLQALDQVEQEYMAEQELLQRRLRDLTHELMGDRPISLSSPEQLSMILYSRKIIDKNKWKAAFNIGVDDNGKAKRRPRMKDDKFRTIIHKQMEKLYKQKAHQCFRCDGTGKIQKYKKDGQPYKNKNNCTHCDATGLTYEDLPIYAGLKLKPQSIQDVSANGFSTNKETLERLADRFDTSGNDAGAQFMRDLVRLNAVGAYLSSFVGGIRKAVLSNGFLHPNFNQCVTATGRLSSSEPNFQNQPRGQTFPIRKCIVSRFDGGEIMEADFGSLEFGVAGFLAQDSQLLIDVQEGEDIHSNTAKALTEAGQPTTRQEAKSRCVPLTTDILTRDGWKTYWQVEVGEEVLTYNQEKDCMEWQPLLEKVYYKDQEVIKLHNGHWSVECTPNHRWYGYRRRDGGPKKGRYHEPCVIEADKLTSECNIYTTAPYKSDRDTIAPREAAILAWIWGDGCVKFAPTTGRTSQCNGTRVGCSAVIVQSKVEHVETLDDLLDGVVTNRSIKKASSEAAIDTTVWRLKSSHVREIYNKAGLDYYEPDYVQFVLGLSDEARWAWLEAMIMAEGTPRKYGEIRLAQNQGPLAEAIKLAGHLSGYGIRVTECRNRMMNWQQNITLRTRRHVTGQRLKTTQSERQDVWCPRTANGTWVMRQNAYTNEREVITITGNTFRPLYGGMMGTTAEVSYFNYFLNRYSGVAEWHEWLCNEALRNGVIRLPSGREYDFPYVKRAYNGSVSGRTQIVNYPVQGFATGDIVPLACVRLDRLMREHGVRSLLINTVHDSIVVDCYPGERDLMLTLMKRAMFGVVEDMEERWGCYYNFPLKVEIKSGPNWMTGEVVAVDMWTPEERKAA